MFREEWLGMLGNSVVSENRSEASQGEHAPFLSKKGLTRALGVQGGARATAGDSGRARDADSAAIPAVPGGGFQVGSGG